MTITAVATGDEPDRPAPRPPAVTAPRMWTTVSIVIMADDKHESRAPAYLRADNDVLEAQYGEHLLVVEVSLPYFFAYLDEARRNRLPLLEAFDLKPSQLKDLLDTPQWLTGEVQELVLTEMDKATETSGPDSVRTVLIDADLLNGESSVVVSALEPVMPNATFFRVTRQHNPPERIPLEPLCQTCHTRMRPAGSMYVCEGCGSTKDRTPEPPLTADQPEGEDPTEEKVDPPPAVDVPDEPEEYGLCGHCGGKMKLEGDEYICLNCGRTRRRTGPETVTD